MIARVTLEIALGKDFDYAVPEELQDAVQIGTRVKVPFGNRTVMGCVTALPESSDHANLRQIVNVIGKQSQVTPNILKLARWIGDYYCCPPEIALKTVLPEVVRREKEGFRELLFVRALQPPAPPTVTKRQQEILDILNARRELRLQELCELANTTAGTIRKLEDKGLLEIAGKISERDPYAREIILPSQTLQLNTEQTAVFTQVIAALDLRQGKTFLLHGVTGSGKTEIYLQAIAHTLR
ncbi:MAG: priA, partial [Verrucomicrobiales bacterium]|nr:priA [Verrucomicrobiales bacterium]